ncbi:MAG TPA: hypothetical protein VG965_05290 [Patescibacteria group bacterium]|nr:hypothetical protein [Patescibacteria group bacterium]
MTDKIDVRSAKTRRDFIDDLLVVPVPIVNRLSYSHPPTFPYS